MYHSRYGPTPTELGGLLPLGSVVASSERLHDGSWAHRLELPSHAAKVQLLDNLAHYDALVPDVRRVAEHVTAGSRSRLEQVERLHRLVRDGVTFTPEIQEQFSPTMRTLELEMGDCDDSARALAALLRSLGFTAPLMTLGSPEPVHVAAGVVLDGVPHWLETTIDARPGEHPRAAADRLGLKMRPDLQ